MYMVGHDLSGKIVGFLRRFTILHMRIWMARQRLFSISPKIRGVLEARLPCAQLGMPP